MLCLTQVFNNKTNCRNNKSQYSYNDDVSFISVLCGVCHFKIIGCDVGRAMSWRIL